MATADKTLVDLELGVGGSGGSENNRGPSAAAGEIVGVTEKGRGTSVSQFSLDLEGGVQVHLAKSERNCRICHLSMDATNQEYGIPIELGCSCKDKLAAVHEQCAEAWFKKGNNKTCEICGSTADNMAGPNEVELIEQWDEANDVALLPPSETRNFWQSSDEKLLAGSLDS